MFTQTWLWISFSAFFFCSNFQYHRNKGTLNGTAIGKQETLSAISTLGVVIFWIIGLFVADRWWHPLAALGISMLGGSLLGSIVDAILPNSVSRFLAAASPIISFILSILLYLVWY